MIRQTLVAAFALVLVFGNAANQASAQQGLANQGGGGGGTGTRATTVGGAASLNDSVQFTTTEDGLGAVGTTQGEAASSRIQGSQLAGQQGVGAGTSTARASTRQFGQAGGAGAGAGGSAGLGRTGATSFGGNTGGNQQQRFGTTAAATVRPSLRLGFTPITRPTTEVSTAVVRRFESISARATVLSTTRVELAGLNVMVADQGVVTLQGSVGSEAAKSLAANILRMEPGVRSIKNELVVNELAQK